MKNLKRYNQLFENTQELTQEQKDWLDKCTKGGAWSVNPKTGLVDVDGGFNCSSTGLNDFKGVRFGKVEWYFICSYNNLKSLEGAPQSVSSGFFCDNNRLKSLEGAPQSVGGSFGCSHNKLKSLKGLPDGFSVRGDFNCSHNELKSFESLPDGFSVGHFNCSNNKLTSLEGLPDEFSAGFFDCSDNDLTSLEGLPDEFKAVVQFDCSHNKLKSLKGLPDGFSVIQNFDCSNNKLTSLEGLPQSAGGDFNCSGNPISERAIRGIFKRIYSKKIPLGQAVSEYWRNLSQDDRAYLSKHHPSLPEKEKRIYRAIELNMKRR